MYVFVYNCFNSMPLEMLWHRFLILVAWSVISSRLLSAFTVGNVLAANFLDLYRLAGICCMIALNYWVLLYFDCFGVGFLVAS